MEFVLLAALGGLGYTISRQQGTRSRYQHVPEEPRASNLITDADTRVLAEDMSLYERKFQESFDPESSGIIPPRNQPTIDPSLPYFSSENKQHTSTYYKQSMVDLFTGNVKEGVSETGYYKNKREADPLFMPSFTGAKVSSGGTSGNPSYDAERQRYVPSNKFHNVRPTKQVQVGRGLGVGPEVPATGGFHEFFRVMPKNVNEYRKTNLPGNVNHGKSLVAREPNQVVMRKNNVDREFETRGYTGVKSAGFNLQTSRADYSQTLDVANTLQDEPWYGPADGDTFGVRAPYGDVTHSRDDNTDRGKVYVTNLTDADTGLGAYATQETQVRDTDREWGPGGITGTKATVDRPYVKQRQRQLAPTNRDTTSAEFSGGAALYNPGQTSRTVNAQRPTNRETTHVAYVGAAGAAGLSETFTDRTAATVNNDRLRAEKRSRTLVGHTNGPMRINKLTNDPGRVFTNKEQFAPRQTAWSSLDTNSRVMPTVEKRNSLQAENPRVL
jgi:hypothetical protein